MKPFTRWALAIISIAVVVTALLLAQEGNFIRKLRDYCNPTAQEAEWLAAFQEVSDEDVVVLHYDNTVMGPESLLPEPEGSILTGLWDGRVVRLLDETRMQHVATPGTNHGYDCKPHEQRDPAKRCSRVLGLEFQAPPKENEKDRMLVLCDGWRGLLLAPIPSQQELDAGTTPTQPEEMQQLLKGDGQYLVRIANGVTEMLDGHHYVTDSCVHSDVGRLGLILFEGSTSGCGKLLKVNVKDNSAEMVGKGIPFANGVVAAHDKQSVLVCALNSREIRKYPLNAKDFDDWSVVVHLPINPDNVKRVTIKGRNLYTVVGFRDLFLPPFSTRTDSDSLLDQLTAATTTAWKRLVRDCLPFPRFGGMLMPILYSVPASYLDSFVLKVAHKSPHGGQVIFFDEDGKVVKWLSREQRNGPATKLSRFAEIIPGKCRFSSEAILHQWPGGTAPVLLVGSFWKDQPLCQVRLGKYF